MADNLLTTKLFAPALDSNKLVERSALNRHLDNGAMGKLTLVSAPAGFGKSTLVSGWLTSRQHDTAWLSLDTGDNEPGIFWQYVLAALQTVEPDIGHDASQILSSPQLANPHPALVSLLNEISARQLTFTLVLDDYHIIESPVIHDSLSFFLEHMPSTGHILLLTRVDPPLPLGRLRANSDLSEIRAADLQFTIGETSEFLNKVMDLELSQEQITTLDKRTEGWVVGLKLAGLSLQRRPDTDRFIDAFSGSHQYILEYLTEEVLSTLSDSQQRFLLHTSILDAFCTSLCEAVTGEPDSQEIIDEAISTNLFVIPLDQSGEWFRYHHLFSELLRSLLARDFTNEVPGLHLRASSWYREAGYLAQAADHVFLSGDMERAKAYVIENWNAMLHRGGVNTVLKWVNRLPDHMAQDDVYLALANCWARHLSGRTLEMAPYVEYAGSAFKRLVDQEQLVGEQRGFVESQVYMMRSALLRSQEQFEDSVRYAEQAVEAVPTNIGIAAGPAWNLLGAARAGAGDIDGGIAAYQKGMGIAYSAENYLSAFAAVFWSTMYLIRQGRLTEAYDTCRLVIERATQDDLAGFPAFGLLYVALALIALERNQLDEARELVLRGGGFSEALRYGRTIRARLHLALGEPETAIAMLEDVERIVTATGEPHAIAEMHFEWAKLHIQLGNSNAVKKRFEALSRMSIGHPLLRFSLDWLAAYTYWAENEFEFAGKTIDRALDRAGESHSEGERLRFLMLKGLVMDSVSRSTESNMAIREGLEIGFEQEYMRSWLDAGRQVTPLLRRARNQPDTAPRIQAYIDDLLVLCENTFGSDLVVEGGLAAILTEREIDIMRLICAGYSNAAIAEQLVVTLNTVKKHTSNIYSKLGVTSRTQAIAKAREFGFM